MNKQAGFTLIELVAVLVILALLGAMAVPRFVDMQAEALTAAQNGSKNAIKSAHALYIAEQKTYPTVDQLAAYVTSDEGVAGDVNGINVTINGNNYKVFTYQNTDCSGATAAAPGNIVRCVGGF